jgi:hypothetical protein
MAPVAWAARRREYAVVNWGYPSRRAPIAAHAAALAGALRALAERSPGPLHLVTHSLGGILVRACLALPAAAAWRHRVGRVVMLAPPNHGSDVAERLRRLRAFRRLVGPAGEELGTGADGVPARLGAPPAGVSVGVIAGARGTSPLFGRWLPRPNDGKVSVASARLPGMADFRVVRRGHTFLMLAPEVHAAVFAFLAHGRFDTPSRDVSSCEHPATRAATRVRERGGRPA